VALYRAFNDICEYGGSGLPKTAELNISILLKAENNLFFISSKSRL
jgi:hypothetical protein